MPWTLSDRAQPVSPLPLHTVDTARLLGLSLRGDGWVRLRRGIYVERTGFQALSPAQRYAVRVHAYLHGHSDAVLCLESAAVLHGIPHFGETRDIHVFAPGQRTSTRQADVVTHTSRDGREIERIGGIWVTSLSDTLLDLARLVPPAHALAMLDAATAPAQGGPLRIDALRDRAQRHRDRRGSARLRWAVDHADALAESVAESISRASRSCVRLSRFCSPPSARIPGRSGEKDAQQPSRGVASARAAGSWGARIGKRGKMESKRLARARTSRRP